jgi:hypothetical protein
MPFQRVLPLGLMMAAVAFCLAGAAAAGESPLPFAPGEKLVFRLQWMSLNAGRATLEVAETVRLDGNPFYHFVLTARNDPWLDPIYPFRHRTDAYADLAMTRSVLYHEKKWERWYRKDSVVRFDWKARQAFYTNRLKRKTRRPIALMPGTFDPLAAFYFTRTAEMKPQMMLTRPVSDGKKCVMGRAVVLRREAVSIPVGTFDAWLLEPEMHHIKGVFRKSKQAKIRLWVTADERRIPLKIESRVSIGHFVGELVAGSVPLPGGRAGCNISP